MIAWLEALTCNVQSASWYWDGEGPEYEMSFGSDYLTIHEDGENKLSVTIPRQRLVTVLYTAFRRFAESSRYRSVDWERPHWRGTPLRTLRSAMVERYIDRCDVT